MSSMSESQRPAEAAEPSPDRRRFLRVAGLSAASLAFLGVSPQAARATGAVIGNDAAWQESLAPYDPYTHTDGATEVMLVRAREHLDIHGVGTDIVELSGRFTVTRDYPRPYDAAIEDGEYGQWTGREGPTEYEWGKAIVFAKFVSLELAGTSQQFGAVEVHLDGQTPTEAVVKPPEGDIVSANACAADLQPAVSLPDLDLQLATPQAVPLASRVIAIPPTGDVARSTAAVPLIDISTHEVVGELVAADIEVGEVIESEPL